ncbi:condensation domain-containing protein [Flavitalea flava]
MVRRKFLSGERIMYINDATSVNCVLAVKIRGTFPSGNLLAALRQLQIKHPLLRAKVEEDSAGIPYFVVDEKMGDIPLLIEKRKSDLDWFIRTKLEWESPFDKKQGPLARVIWLKSEEVSELLVVCPHFICDGISLVNLMRELLMVADQPDTHLSPTPASGFHSLEMLLSAHLGSAKKRFFKARVFSLLAAVALAFRKRYTAGIDDPSGDGYMIRWKLTRENSEILIDRCRSEGASVHAALCVAFLAAFREVKGKKARGKVICPVDIRRLIPEIKTDDLFAFAPIVELSTGNDPISGFWEKARKFKRALAEKIARLNGYELLLISEQFHSLVKKMVNFLLSTEGSHDFTLSNMGRLEIPPHYLGFAVETIYSPTVLFPWRNPNTIVVSSFKGQMDFTILSNAVFLTYKEAEAIRDKAMELLLKGGWKGPQGGETEEA